MILEEGYTALKKCECQKARQSKVIIEKSGLKKLIQEYTMESYLDTESWQQTIKKTAQTFIQDPETHWFFIGGQVGSGKTHICTAIVNELMNQGREALYMLWRDEIVKLKAKAMEGLEYQKTIQAYKTIKVFYIDDLFKTEKVILHIKHQKMPLYNIALNYIDAINKKGRIFSKSIDPFFRASNPLFKGYNDIFRHVILPKGYIAGKNVFFYKNYVN